MSNAPLLDANNLAKAFGGIRALRGVSLSVERGSLTGLIGPNGSGKTTLFNTITGFLSADSGTASFEGELVTGLSPSAIARKGLARTFQNPAELGDLSVMQNVLASTHSHPGDELLSIFLRPKKVREVERRTVERAWRVLADVGLEHLANTRANELSIGENRLLQMARLLMTRPRLLLLDEPTSGINPDVQQLLAALIRRLRVDEGISFLIIEHNLGFIRALCDKLYVMHLGEVISAGNPDEVARDPIVRETYLGAS